MVRKVRISVRWYINCGCGLYTSSLKEAVDHVKKTGHKMDGKVAVARR